ncbi:ABC transporter substrate-binding protein [Ensifer sp. LC13]|uniref:ABC transporter substrate-binding protein n=2 Tax=Ensifer TaxID=106591 RepID=UPI000813783C|nr:ABC transporter substrate-binding protein [Ensifer sp. LC11]OCO99383.1 ABC transporter substrate-binding protein [Ensifer sp. LC13]OCP12973.1 ABC transporter substrate-binding protein [Ensifer sp. LC14]OCP29697.1 ABC transporter substrate-binding protein [Ensifer sp. LC499]
MTGNIISFGKTAGHGLRARASTMAAATLALTLSSSTAVFAEDAKFDPNASITIGSLYEPQNLDNTAGAGQGINEAFNGNVYEALFTLTDAGDVQPGLVAEQSVSDDGLTYTFKLRPGVTFHSGDPLTAVDVKYSIERVTAEQSKSSRKKSLATISAIETPDEQTVVVKLSARSISLPYNLSYVWIVNDAAKDLNAGEDGTGPYRLDEWRRGSSLALTRNDKYWGTAPTNGEVVFQYFTDATALNNALLTGAVDIITSVQSPDSIAQFKDNPDFTVTAGQSTTKELLAFNDRVAPFDNVKVRKAIARAIDDKKLLTSIWGEYGTLIGSFVPPTDPWYVDLTAVDAYDVESAKALLKEAGFADGFAFKLDTPNYDPHPIVAQFIQSELAKVNIKVEINVITANEWYTKVYKAHDFQATLQEHVNHRDIVFYGNPDFYWGYNNPRVVDLIKASEAAANTDEQTAKLKEANTIIAEDAASNWLYLYPQIVVSSSAVTGYPVNGLNSQFFAYGIKKSEQ